MQRIRPVDENREMSGIDCMVIRFGGSFSGHTEQDADVMPRSRNHGFGNGDISDLQNLMFTIKSRGTVLGVCLCCQG